MPEMSVVRFNESDVIVASGGSSYIPKTAVLKNWNDGQITNGNVTFSEGGVETVYSYQNNNIGDTFLFYGPYANYKIQVSGGGTTTFSQLTYHEGNNAYEGTNGPVDGTYIWNETTNVFDFSHQ